MVKKARYAWHVRATLRAMRTFGPLRAPSRVITPSPARRKMALQPRREYDMENDMHDDAADHLADEALNELGADPLDPPDEYAELCEFAGCYPWMDDFVLSHPHDAAVLASLRGDIAEPDTP